MSKLTFYTFSLLEISKIPQKCPIIVDFCLFLSLHSKSFGIWPICPLVFFVSTFTSHCKKSISNKVSIKEYHPILQKLLISIYGKLEQNQLVALIRNFVWLETMDILLTFYLTLSFFYSYYGQNNILALLCI